MAAYAYQPQYLHSKCLSAGNYSALEQSLSTSEKEECYYSILGLNILLFLHYFNPFSTGELRADCMAA